MWGTVLRSMVAAISLLGLCAPLTLAQNKETANTPGGAWMVQLGSFGEEQNARRLADRPARTRMRALGYCVLSPIAEPFAVHLNQALVRLNPALVKIT